MVSNTERFNAVENRIAAMEIQITALRREQEEIGEEVLRRIDGINEALKQRAIDSELFKQQIFEMFKNLNESRTEKEKVYAREEEGCENQKVSGDSDQISGGVIENSIIRIDSGTLPTPVHHSHDSPHNSQGTSKQTHKFDQYGGEAQMHTHLSKSKAGDIPWSVTQPQITRTSDIQPIDREHDMINSNRFNDHNAHIRIEFPRFNGDNPRSWIRKCYKFFLIHPMPDCEKIILASIYMEDAADFWYMGCIDGKEEDVSWNQFTELILRRFSNVEDDNLVGQFNKLQQEGTVMEYVHRFEELKFFMCISYPCLTEEHFVQSFMSGLSEEISHMLRIIRPTTLRDAIQLAVKQEHILQLSSSSTNLEDMGSQIRRLTPAEMELRMKKNLCVNCDEIYQKGHKCKKLFVILGK